MILSSDIGSRTLAVCRLFSLNRASLNSKILFFIFRPGQKGTLSRCETKSYVRWLHNTDSVVSRSYRIGWWGLQSPITKGGVAGVKQGYYRTLTPLLQLYSIESEPTRWTLPDDNFGDKRSGLSEQVANTLLGSPVFILVKMDKRQKPNCIQNVDNRNHLISSVRIRCGRRTKYDKTEVIRYIIRNAIHYSGCGRCE